MPIAALRLDLVVSPGVSASDILHRSDWFEMGWIYAISIPAKVVELKSLFDRPVDKRPCNFMGTKAAPIVSHISISARVLCALPDQALAGSNGSSKKVIKSCHIETAPNGPT